MLNYRPFRLFIFSLGILLIINLTRSILSVWKKEAVVVDEEKRLSLLQQQHQEQQKKLDLLKSPTFIEEQARSKLNLARDGDYIVVLPQVTPYTHPTPTPMRTNWQQWRQLWLK